MAEGFITVTGTEVTHDETDDLQNSAQTPNAPGDADDDDILVSDLDADFLARLAVLGLDPDDAVAPDALGAARSDGNVITLSTSGNMTGLGFSDANGADLDGDSSGLFTTNGSEIYLFSDPTNNNIVYGSTDPNLDFNTFDATSIAFVLHLAETGDPVSGATVEVVQYKPLNQGDDGNDHDSPLDLTNKIFVTASGEIEFSEFADTPPGQQLWSGFGPTTGTADDPDILVTGINPDPDSPSAGDRVNVSTTGLGENSQAVGQFEGLRIDFVNGLFFPNQTQADSPVTLEYDDHFESGGAGWSPVQVNPGNPNIRVDAKITAWDVTGDWEGQAFFDQLGSQTAVNIASVQVFDETGVLIEDTADPGIDDPDVSVTITGNIAEVIGLKEDYLVKFRTETPNMDRFTIENISSNSKLSFDVGNILNLEAAADTDEVGSRIFFEDDGPTIDLTSLEPAIVLDESVGVDAGDLNAADEEAAGAPDDAIGYAAISAAALFSETAVAGEDGEASTVYSLVLNAGATGLTDTESGQAVVLSLVNGTVEGRTDAAAAELVLTIDVDADGNVEAALFRALDHGADLNDHDSAVSMAAGLVELQATLTDGDTDFASDKIELGSLIDYEDDGPVLEATTDDVVVDFVANDSDGDPNLGLDYGEDTPGALKITSFEAMPDDTVLGQITEMLSADGTTLTYSNVDGPLFELSLDDSEPGAYTFTVLQGPPLVTNTLDFAGNDPGGPVEDITISAPGGTNVTFDGFLLTDFDANLKGQFAAGDLNDPADDDDDPNVSQPGVGLKDNQMDPNEALQLTLDPAVAGIELKFDGATGGGQTFRIKIEAYDSEGTLVFADFAQEAAPKGNAVLLKSYVFEDPAVEVYIGLDFDTASSGVRIAEVAMIEKVETPDFELDYTVTAEDGDTDFTTTEFTVGIDGNSDGLLVA